MSIGELDRRNLLLADFLSHGNGGKESEITHANDRSPRQKAESSMHQRSRILDFRSGFRISGFGPPRSEVRSLPSRDPSPVFLRWSDDASLPSPVCPVAADRRPLSPAPGPPLPAHPP